MNDESLTLARFHIYVNNFIWIQKLGFKATRSNHV